MTPDPLDDAVRGGITAAAAILGVRVAVHDGRDWWMRDGVVHIGLGWAARRGPGRAPAHDPGAPAHDPGGPAHDPGAPARDPGPTADTVARVALLLWESVREVRVAPARRRRRLALSAERPELEPLLAMLDRLLAAAELLAAMPSLRLPVAQALADESALGDRAPMELPRHLQWVVLALGVCAHRWATGGGGTPEFAETLAPEVRHEFELLDGLGGETAEVIGLAFAPDPRRTPIERFERAYGVFAPGYQRLLAADLAGRGPQSGGPAAGESKAGEEPPGSDADLGLGDTGGAGEGEQGPEQPAESAAGGDSARGGDADQARAGDTREGAEGSDLFEAEHAGFVETVLATPLPASGAWAAGAELPDVQAVTDPQRDTEEQKPRRADPGTPGGAGGHAALSSYRDRVALNARSIDGVREVWRHIVSERVHVTRGFSRTPQAEGDLLDRGALVRVVSDVAAGVERPRAFLRRERRVRPTQREGSTDYVLLIDRSASMQGPPSAGAATAALIMLEALAAVDRDIAAEERALGIDLELSLRTALIVFDSTPHTVKPLAGALDDRARLALDEAIHSPQGSTNDAAALRAAADELGLNARQGAGPASGSVTRRRVVILVSDGGTNDAVRAASELARLRAHGVTVFGIGIRTDDLAARFAPDGMRLDAADELPAVLQRLVTAAGLGR
ncbi:vWA domain-containing protein [Leucobacter albus]|uniref:VWA domain-containing protein n=1 Tax=Leucobacter albus TaxID=272210 RepID=A0ABW3TL42_9MICO